MKSFKAFLLILTCASVVTSVAQTGLDTAADALDTTTSTNRRIAGHTDLDDARSRYDKLHKDTCAYKGRRRCRDRIIISNTPGMMDEIGAHMSTRVARASVTPPE